MRKISLCLLALLTMAGGAVHAAEPIRVIVPFAAGGPVDAIGRIMINEMQRTLGETIIIESRGGGGGVIGTEFVTRQEADGRTLLLGTLGSHVIGSVLRPAVKFDPVKSFDAIAMIGHSPTLMTVARDLPVKNFAEFVALAKTKPMNFGSAGPGTSMHIAGEMFNLSTKSNIAHISYRGAALAIPDLLAGRLDMISADPPVMLPIVEQNQARPVAVLGRARLRALPDVPTTIELGYPDMIMENWYGLMAPAGVPADVRAKLEKAALEAIASPAMQEHMRKGEMTGTLDAKDFQARIESDVTTWRKTLATLGISLEGDAPKPATR